MVVGGWYFGLVVVCFWVRWRFCADLVCCGLTAGDFLGILVSYGVGII